ncbi:PadR family transcriptional regulator, partial [Acinetobacter baumannii]
MSIQHALLTSLLEKPSSGYELARRFDKSMGYFWSATHQQIYRELGRMAEAGWVSVEEEEDGRKKTYTVL